MTRSAFRRAVHGAFAGLAALVLGACSDNIGRAFDPNVNPNEPGGGTATPSTIQVVPVGGDAVDGRPRVRAAFPKGAGWPITVPVVVEFSESVNEASLRPSGNNATDARLYLRVKGTTTALPAQYDFVLGGTVAILRPLTSLSNAQATPYEVVLKPEARDADGVRFANSAEEVLAEFTVDEAESVQDGRILTVLPRDNARDVRRQTDVFVVFNKPPVATSVTTTTLSLRSGGVAIDGAVATPLRLATTGEDPRVARFRPRNPLPAGATVEVVVTGGITFGQSGVLQFNNRTPFSRFDTLAFLRPTAVAVANTAPGYADQINRALLANLALQVTTPDTAQAGDRVVARIYGLDKSTQAVDDVAFVERTASVPAAGVQTVTVSFAGALGTLDRPKFDDGAVTLTAQLQRGSLHSGFAHGASNTGARFDITPPTLVRAGPPNVEGALDILTDQETLAFYGAASEPISAAEIVDGVTTATLWASDDTGRFLMQPIPLGRLTAPRGYQINLTDDSGNLSTQAFTGNIRQRGLLTGATAAELTVEVYDSVTLRVIAGATVILDPGAPTVPPAAGRVVATTGADGRAVFTGLPPGTRTVTVVHAGHDLTTLYETGVAFASLPLRPQTGATASFDGTAQFTPAPNNTAVVGNTAFDDPLVLSVTTATATPTAIPATAIQPFRPQVVTAFSGLFEATSTPTFGSAVCAICGTDGVTATAPLAPVSPGATGSATLALLPATGTIAGLPTPITKNLATAAGLDPANLVAPPIARITSSLFGFGGQALLGIGTVASAGGTSYTVNGSFLLAPLATLVPFAPINWVVTEARDAAGAVSRHRALLTNFGTLLDLLPMPSVPTVAAPGGPATGAPAVSFADVLNRASLPAGQAIGEVLATDPAGRAWRVLYEDGDGAGASRTIQFPSLAGTGATGLATGTWNIRAEARLFLSTTSTPGDLVLAERRRQEVTYTRSPTVAFQVQ